MTKIVKYDELYTNYATNMQNINELMTVVENINSEFQNLSSAWEGTLASSFFDLASKVSEFSKQNVLNFKNTEEFKNVVIYTFKETEKSNANTYF